jgi:hypothetical protein
MAAVILAREDHVLLGHDDERGHRDGHQASGVNTTAIGARSVGGRNLPSQGI